MIGFLKKHSISLGLLFVSGMVGLVLVYFQTPTDIWIVEYEFDRRNAEKLPRITQVDTVFLVEGYVVRNSTGSINDTLRHKSLSRYEAKIYLPSPSTEKHVLELGRRVLKHDFIEVKRARIRETQRNKSIFLYFLLFGFFLGIVVEFVGGLKQHPSTTKKG